MIVRQFSYVESAKNTLQFLKKNRRTVYFLE